MRNAVLLVIAWFAIMAPAVAQPVAYLDSTFADDGIALPGRKLSTARTAYLLDTAGRILICGHNDTAAATVRMIRMLPDGTALDTSFHLGSIGLAGEQVLEQDHSWAQDGKVVGVGRSRVGTDDYNIAVWRFLPDGSPDSLFDMDGYLVTEASFNDVYPWRVAVSPDSVIMVTAGESLIGGHYNGWILRYLPDGELDGFFDGDGIWKSDLGSDDLINDLAFKADGNILFCGRYMPVPAVSQAYVGLMDDRGNLENTFGSSGYVDFPDAALFAGMQYTCLVDIDTTLMAAGVAKDPGFFRNDLLLSRFLADGTPDTSFSSDGYLLLNLGGQATVQHMLIQPDGKILVGGVVDYGSAGIDFFIARFLPNGDLDVGTITDGVIKVDPAASLSGTVEALNNLALLPDGRILAGGTYTDGVNDSAILMRFMSSLEILLTTEDFDASQGGLLVYPNPVVDQLNVQLPAHLAEARFSLHDLTGRLVADLGQHMGGVHRLAVPPMLGAGAYLLRVSTPEGTAWVRWVRQ